MKQHFVQFLSPGTFVAEETIQTIDGWNVDQAVEMARTIVERHNARPYGFRFLTRERSLNELDSHVSNRSGVYYLGGKIETIEQVRNRADPDEHILLSNMEGNGIERIVVNQNSWRWTQPLNADDVVLQVEL